MQNGNNDREFIVQVTTDAIALYVWIDSPVVGGRFAENGFLLVEEEKEVIFYATAATNEQELYDTLTVVNLLSDQFL